MTEKPCVRETPNSAQPSNSFDQRLKTLIEAIRGARDFDDLHRLLVEEALHEDR